MADTNEYIVVGFKAHLINDLFGIHGIVEPGICGNKCIIVSMILSFPPTLFLLTGLFKGALV